MDSRDVPAGHANSREAARQPIDGRTVMDALTRPVETYLEAVNDGPIGVLVIGHDFRPIYVNDRLCSMLGYSRNEMLSLSPSDLTHPDDIEADRALSLQLLAGDRQSYSLEKRYIKKDGAEVCTILSVSLMRDDAGRPLYAIATITDITDAKRAEEKLSKRERHFRMLADNSLDLIVESSLDGKLKYVSPNSADIIGYTAAELVDGGAFDLLHPDEVRAIDQETELALSKGRVAQYVHRLKVKSGEWRWFEGLGKPLEYPSGETTMLISYRDIMERKRAVEELRHSEERYRALYTNTPAMLHSVDLDGRIVSVNDRWLQTLGYERQEVLGRKATDFQTQESRVQAETVVLPRFWYEGTAKEVPLQFLTKHGHIVDVLLSAIVERDADGNVVGTMEVLNDVTERKSREEALLNAREELEGRVERQMLLHNPYKLTFREFTVLHLLGAGRSDKEIAGELVISRLTAQKHVSNILGKMSATSRTEAAIRALREGLLD